MIESLKQQIKAEKIAFTEKDSQYERNVARIVNQKIDNILALLDKALMKPTSKPDSEGGLG